VGAKGAAARYHAMSDSLDDHHAPTAVETAQAAGRLARGFNVRTLARRAREAQLGGNALLGAGVSLTVLAAVVLLWDGIVEGIPRVVLLLLAAGLIRLRLITVRLSYVTPADGMSEPPPRGGLLRWINPIESAFLMFAAGMNVFGAGSDWGPVVGVLAAAMVIAASLRRRSPHAVQEPTRPHPTTLLVWLCLFDTLSPLWGWRSRTMLIGLCAISAVLLAQTVWVRRPAAG
jgi:hypothetical protein